MTPKEYREIVAKLLGEGHWMAVSGLWSDIFNPLILRGAMLEAGVGIPGERPLAECREILRDLFRQVQAGYGVENGAGPKAPKPDAAWDAYLEILSRGREAVGPLAHDEAEFPTAIRELLMDVWDDADGRLLNPTRTND
jgi:hypothetical protein